MVVARSGAAGDDFSDGPVGVVGGAGYGIKFGSVERVVTGEVGDEVGDCVGVVEVGWGWEGGESFALSVIP